MADILSGIITSVKGRDVFEMRILTRGGANILQYAEVERIRAASIVAYDEGTTEETKNNISLEENMLGMAARCVVRSREDSNKLVADVMIYGFRWLKNPSG